MLPTRFPEPSTTPPTGRRRRSPILAAAAAGALVITGLAVAPAAFANHPEVSLFGSNFEIDTDANLRVDDAAPPSIDWANVAETRKGDAPSGTGDDSFGQGAKEDTPAPAVVSGSIPPNKSDLLTFGMTLEENVDTDPSAPSPLTTCCTCTGIACRSRTEPRTWTSSSTSRRHRPRTA